MGYTLDICGFTAIGYEMAPDSVRSSGARGDYTKYYIGAEFTLD